MAVCSLTCASPTADGGAVIFALFCSLEIFLSCSGINIFPES